MQQAMHDDQAFRKKAEEDKKKKKDADRKQKKKEAREEMEMVTDSELAADTLGLSSGEKKPNNRELIRSNSRKNPTIQEQLDQLEDMLVPVPEDTSIDLNASHTTVGQKVVRQRCSTATPTADAAKKPSGKPKTKRKKKAVKLEGGEQKIVLSDQACTKMMALAGLLKEVKIAAHAQSEAIDNYEDVLSYTEDSADNLTKLCGTCQTIWRIDNFRNKFKSSTDEKKILYSPSLVTHPYGYHVAASLCPYGDGKGRGKYMSIFFCILRGTHDSLLQWPFSSRITFTLMDQSDEAEVKDIAAQFEPHPAKENIPFLGRPTAMRNPSLGLPRFAPLTDLWGGRYVKDDVIFIKIEVDIDNTPVL